MRPAKPKLSRRWSLNDINSKEGYVKDLRKQHQAQQVGQRDEAYPFMMTEKKRVRHGSLNINLESPRRPLSCSPPGGLFLGKRTRAMSLDEENEAVASIVRSSRPKRSSVPTLRSFKKGGSSADLATCVVPEDFEFHMEEKVSPKIETLGPLENPSASLFRKRSSSLPRILPPICDHDEEDTDDILEENDTFGGRLAVFKQMDQTSNLIVREMQKFVCKNAADVSQMLPLPIPTNARQQNRLNPGKPFLKNDYKHTQIVLQNLAKVHAIGYAISEKNPQLFLEIANSLESSSCKRRVELDNRPALIKILEVTPLTNHEINYEEIISTIKSQANELYSNHLCPLFPVIVHGHLKHMTFKYNQDSEVIGVKLSSLRYSLIGSPLLDIYATISNGQQIEVQEHLTIYLDAFLKHIKNLKITVKDLSLDTLMTSFKKYELTGMIITSLKKTQQPQIELGRSCSLGGHDMLMRNYEKPLHDLGNDLCKLAIDIPFSHDEDPEEDIFN